MAKHRPVNADPRRAYLQCTCGWESSESHTSMDSAWDEYDEHTME